MSEEKNLLSFWGHLEELRVRILKIFIVLIITSLISFSIADRVIALLAEPVGGLSKLQSIEVTENVSVFMRVSLMTGLVISSPFILYQVLAFLVPGMTLTEKRWVYSAIPLATLLFLSGIAFCYFIMLKNAVPFLLGFLGVEAIPRLSNYISFITNFLLWIGLSFEFPLLVFLLAKLKLVSAGMLAKQWRIAVIAIAVVAAVITPTVDPINMGLFMMPLFLLYLISILFAFLAKR